MDLLNKLKDPQTNWKYILIVVILAGIVGGGILSYSKDVEKEINSLTQFPEIKKPEKIDETVNWEIYRNEEYGFEIKYPEKIITVSEENEKIVMIHSVLFEHPDPCDFKGDAPSLKKITDFNIGIKITDKNLQETVIKKESDYFISNFLLDNKLKIVPNFIDEVIINSLEGYRITTGAGGCGQYTYYFPLTSNNTLIVIRSFIAEFNPINTDYEKYLKLPGVISPEEEEELFNQILSTFKFLE